MNAYKTEGYQQMNIFLDINAFDFNSARKKDADPFLKQSKNTQVFIRRDESCPSQFNDTGRMPFDLSFMEVPWKSYDLKCDDRREMAL